MTQQAKHTPGPWHVENRSVNGCNLGIYDARGNVVAVIDATPITLPRKRADASAMAAAPELLAALEDFVALDHASPRSKDGERAFVAVRDLEAFLSRASTAIAKAEGR